jgi:PAS domain S-box-containing protein
MQKMSMEQHGLGVYEYKFDGTITYIDKVIIKILDLSATYPDSEMAVGRKIGDLIGYTSSTGTVRSRIKKTGHFYGDDYHFKTLKGEDRWVIHDAYQVEHPETGEALVHVVVTDITERKQTEKNLLLSKQKLDLHFLQTPLAVIEWDLEFNVRSWNPAAEKIFGYAENEILGKHSSIIVPEKYQNQIDMIWAGLLEQKGGKRSTNENITKNGDNIFCEWFNTPIIDKTGKTIAVFSLAQDVTEHKKAEEIKKVLFTISNAVNITRNLKDLFEITHSALSSIIDVTNFFIAMVDIKKSTLYFPYHVDTKDDDFFPITDFDTKNSLTGLVVSQRRPILLKKNDLEKISAQKGVWGPVPLIWMGAPLIVKDEIIGVVAVQSYLDSNLYNEQDLQVLSGISDQMAIAIDRKQAEEEVKKRTNELKRLNDHLILSEDRERKNVASELHDSVAQSLAMAISKIKTIKEVDSGYGIETLSNVQKNIENAIKEVRILIHQLHPQILEDFSIDMVLDYLIETVKEKKQLSINYINNLTEPINLIETTKFTIYRAINELLNNILKHSGSLVAEIELSKINNNIQIRVEDKGTGFELNTHQKKNYCGFGLYSLSERIKNMGGELIINSSSGKGTKVILIVPVNV